jgi:hypothetical protein
MRRLWLLAMLAGPVAMAAPERVLEFTRTADLALEGKGAIYALELPVEAYRGIERRDLGDLRVQNGAGEFVPHALVRPPASERKPVPALSMTFFPLLGAPGRPVEDMTLRVERRPDGTVKAVVATGERSASPRRIVAYIIDASAATAALRELRFDWQAESEGTSLDVRVEASDDLRAWRGVGAGALIVLRQGDALLERRSIELSPTKAKYFRVAWRPAQEVLKLTGVSALAVDAVAESPRAWLRAEGRAGAKPGEYLFELPLGLPVDRLRFELPQENTVASSTVLIQDRPGGPERTLASTVLYRMEHRGQKLVNPDLEFAPTAEKRWVLRVDARGGGLGSGLPVLHAGFVPHRLVFVARGEPPFRALFGNADAAPAALAVQTLVPGYAADKPIAALAARLGEVRTREIVKPTGAEAARGYVEQMDEKKVWLWGSLLLAVLVIVGMAFRLTRQMPAPGEPPKPRAPGETR